MTIKTSRLRQNEKFKANDFQITELFLKEDNIKEIGTDKEFQNYYFCRITSE